MILVAWCVNLVEKHLATLFGGALTALGMAIAVGVRRAWFVDLLHANSRQCNASRRAPISASEALADEELKGLVTLADAVELKALVSRLDARGAARRISKSLWIREVSLRAKGRGDSAIYCIYVEEWPGLFDGRHTAPPQ